MTACTGSFIPKSRVLSKSTRKHLRHLLAFLLFAALMALSGCTLPFLAELASDDTSGSNSGRSGLEPLMIPVSSERFTVAWDPSDSAVDEYRLYYRPHGGSDWHQLSTVGAGPDQGGSVSFDIDQDVLDAGPGEYEFAVSSVHNGEESPLHTSLSEDAEPDRGWYVRWEPA